MEGGKRGARNLPLLTSTTSDVESRLGHVCASRDGAASELAPAKKVVEAQLLCDTLQHEINHVHGAGQVRQTGEAHAIRHD